jgi:ubiquinone/menaquinone biosynthesis C-methylase UbiE
VSSPWLDIPLEDYEAHMSLASVGQAQLIAQHLEQLVRESEPASVAVIGCAGGNGFECLVEAGVSRVVGVDINARYVEKVRERYAGVLPGLELFVADIQSGGAIFAPVDLIYVALVLEYVDVRAAMGTLGRHCRPSGVLATLTQLPHESLGHVSDSPYVSLKKLGPVMGLVGSDVLVDEAARGGLALQGEPRIVATPVGKRFALHRFQRSNGMI